MAYITSVNHLLNFVNKYSANEKEGIILSKAETVHVKKLLSDVFKNNSLLNRFTYVIYNNNPIVNPSFVQSFINENKNFKPKDYSIVFEDCYQIRNTNELSSFCNELRGVSGVYIMHEGDNIHENMVYYVGFSSDLCSRISGSLKSKVKKMPMHFRISVITKYNITDSSILEIYLINLLNPIFNTTSAFDVKSYLLSDLNISVDMFFDVKLNAF